MLPSYHDRALAGTDTDILRNQARGITGALLVVGLAVLYTSEMWWLAWRLPIEFLIV